MDSQSTLTDPDAETPAAKPVVRYANLAGAEVHVIPGHARRAGGDEYVWTCTGCLHGVDFPNDLGWARSRAAGHAEICRALPPL